MNLIDAYIRHMHTRNRSPLTYEHYEQQLNKFNDYLLEHGTGNLETGDVSHVTRRTLEDYYQTLMDKVGVSTRNNYVSILKGFFKYLYENEYMAADISPALGYVDDRYSETPPEDGSADYYPAGDLQKLYGFFARKPTDTNLRNMALVSLMLSTGLRISEVCGLNVSVVRDMENGKAQCLRKGGFWQTIKVSEDAVAHLKRYLGPRIVNGSDPLFLSNKLNRLTRNAAWKSLARVQRQLELDTGTHILRHTAITTVAHETGSTTEAFLFAGHRNPATTAKYIHAKAV